jgi:hypothetical protein
MADSLFPPSYEAVHLASGLLGEQRKHIYASKLFQKEAKFSFFPESFAKKS